MMSTVDSSSYKLSIYDFELNCKAILSLKVITDKYALNLSDLWLTAIISKNGTCLDEPLLLENWRDSDHGTIYKVSNKPLGMTGQTQFYQKIKSLIVQSNESKKST